MKNLIIILENPKYAGNIGMVCRLIANFNLPPLRIIGDKKDLNFEMEWMAHNSNEELSKIEYFPSCKESCKDLSMVFGTAMIHGKNRVGFIPLSTLSEKINYQNDSEQKIGVAFGREDRGLSNAMLDICDFAVDFKLPGNQPSMNLSQSVSFVLGGIFSRVPLQNPNLDKEIVEKEKFYEYAREVFNLIELNQFHGRENLAIKRFKKIIDSSSISREDLNFLYKIFQKIEFKIKDKSELGSFGL